MGEQALLLRDSYTSDNEERKSAVEKYARRNPPSLIIFPENLL